MNHISKKMIVSVIMAVAFVVTLGSIHETDYVADEYTAEVSNNGMATAGITSALAVTESGVYADATASLDDSAHILVGTDETDEGEEAVEEPVEDSEWSARLMANVDSYLAVREGPSEDAELLGKMYPGDVAEIVSTDGDWTEITSGNVKGFVSSKYCVFNDDAKALADELCKVVATSSVDGLRIRKSPSEDGDILNVLDEGDAATVDKEAEETEGWIAVIYKGTNGYVSADYVTVEQDLGTAITVEEEYEIYLAKKAAEEAAAAKAAAAQTTETTRTQSAAVAASCDDLTLLAALIQCEAGGESYEGQLAVGAVVMNRLRSGIYGSTLYDVIYSPHQFGPAGSGKLARVIAAGPMASCYQAAQEALNGVSNVGGAMSFCRNNGHEGIVIGNQVFY